MPNIPDVISQLDIAGARNILSLLDDEIAAVNDIKFTSLFDLSSFK